MKLRKRYKKVKEELEFIKSLPFAKGLSIKQTTIKPVTYASSKNVITALWNGNEGLQDAVRKEMAREIAEKLLEDKQIIFDEYLGAESVTVQGMLMVIPRGGREDG